MRLVPALILALGSLAARPAHAQLAGALVINEFVASNDSVGGYREPDGGYGDWIELYNRSNRTLDLTGAQLSDDALAPDKWTFPAGTTMAPNSYLIVWADEDLDQAGLHASFRLSRDGEDLVLSSGGAVIDAHTFGPQETNVSEARLPNGTGAFAKTARTTPNASNNSSSVGEVAVVRIGAAPNPAPDFVELTLGDAGFERYSLHDPLGRVLATGTLTRGARVLRLATADLPPGSYHVAFDGGRGLATFVR